MSTPESNQRQSGAAHTRTATIRILLTDDHKLTRAGLRLLLQQIPSIEVVAEASDGREALALIEKHRPDLVLMDILMPELNGIDTTRHVVKDFPSVKVIILSSYTDEERVLGSLRAGAAGYLLKSADFRELEIAVHSVAGGDTYLSPAIAKHVITRSLSEGHQGKLDHLTARQREILQLVAEGKSTKEIAFLFNVSVKTVETHRTQLMERLEIFDLPGLVRYALRMGLIAE